MDTKASYLFYCTRFPNLHNLSQNHCTTFKDYFSGHTLIFLVRFSTQFRKEQITHRNSWSLLNLLCRGLDICLIFCWILSSHLSILHSYEDVTIAGEELQILTFARHSWPWSSEGSLTSHNYCDRGLPFNWSSPRTCDTHTCCRAFGSWAVTICFYDLGLSRPGIKPRSPACEASALPLRHRSGLTYVEMFEIKSSQYITNIFLPVKKTQYRCEIMNWIRINAPFNLAEFYFIWININNGTFWDTTVSISVFYGYLFFIIFKLNIN